MLKCVDCVEIGGVSSVSGGFCPFWGVCEVFGGVSTCLPPLLVFLSVSGFARMLNRTGGTAPCPNFVFCAFCPFSAISHFPGLKLVEYLWEVTSERLNTCIVLKVSSKMVDYHSLFLKNGLSQPFLQKIISVVLTGNLDFFFCSS